MPKPHRLCFVLLAAVAAAVVFTGCTGQRSLLAVRESGERALEERRFNDAVNDFEEYVERLPGDAVGRYNLGVAYLNATPARPMQAREHLYLAYSQRLNDDDVFEALCRALANNNQNEELFRLMRQRALDRQRVSDYMRLGRFAAELGDPDQARQAFLTAARLDAGQSVEVQLALADLYETLGDDDRALLRLRMALFLDPINTTIAQRIRAHGEVPGPSFALRPAEQEQ